MPTPSISCRSLASKAFARAEAAARLNYLEVICTQSSLPGQHDGCVVLSDKWLCHYHPGKCLNLSSIPCCNSTDLIFLLFCSWNVCLLTTMDLSVCMDCCLEAGRCGLPAGKPPPLPPKWELDRNFLHLFATCPVSYSNKSVPCLP